MATAREAAAHRTAATARESVRARARERAAALLRLGSVSALEIGLRDLMQKQVLDEQLKCMRLDALVHALVEI